MRCATKKKLRRHFYPVFLRWGFVSTFAVFALVVDGEMQQGQQVVVVQQHLMGCLLERHVHI